MDVQNLLKDCIDIHVHVGPEAFKTRKFNEYALGEELIRCGAYGAVIKTHIFETATRAALVNQHFADKIHLFGGLALNEATGGLNAQAVRAVASLGGKIIWLPTMDAEHERAAMGKSGGVVCTRNGKTVDEMDEVLKAIADTGMVLATGHLAWQEQEIVVKRAKELGVAQIIVNHPTLFRTAMPRDVQKSLAEYDGVYLERNYGGTRLPESRVFETHFEKNLQDILALGVEKSILATDLGQPGNPMWAEGYMEYLSFMMEHGISEQQIRMMIRDNPRKVLGIT